MKESDFEGGYIINNYKGKEEYVEIPETINGFKRINSKRSIADAFPVVAKSVRMIPKVSK